MAERDTSMITPAESSRQITCLTEHAQAAERAGPVDDAIAAWLAVLDHPCAHHQVVDYEILDEIHQLLRRAGRYDEAIAAKRQAIAAGYRSQPDAEADIAECLLLAGRRDEADQLYAELRERDPEDVWLNNSAAYAYGGVDDREALRWSLDGIELAMVTGDYDEVSWQLVECAERSWAALGEPVDQAVLDRVEAFQRSWKRPAWKNPFPDLAREPQYRCSHCGWDPEDLGRPSGGAVSPPPPAQTKATSSRPARRDVDRSLPVAVAWFAASEWGEAVRRWPDLLDDLPAEHLAYSHEIEARTKRLARHLPGKAAHIAPLTVDRLIEHALDGGDDPGSAEARSSLAAEVLRAGDAIHWPPSRNEPCWCGSGNKYKQCCGPIPPAADG